MQESHLEYSYPGDKQHAIPLALYESSKNTNARIKLPKFKSWGHQLPVVIP